MHAQIRLTSVEVKHTKYGPNLDVSNGSLNGIKEIQTVLI